MGIFSRKTKMESQEEPKTQTPKAASSTTSGKKHGVDTSDVIVHPLISEKAAGLAGANQYVFVVHKDANRIQIRAPIKAMYGVSLRSINVLNVRGKKVRFGRRQGVRNDWKKAIITLPAGQTINVHEGV